MRRLLPVVATAFGLTAGLVAQNQFLPFGSRVQIASGTSMNTLNLGFPFTMPGGSIVTQVDADTHGRIVEVGADPSDGSETVAEMLADPTGSINVLWDTQSYTVDPNAGLFFQTDNATVAVVSWVNVNFTAVCTYQCQLWADGRIVMVYDSRCPADDGIIGVSPGNGAAPPAAQTDLSASINSALVTVDPTVYEDFGFTAGVDAFDLPASALEFVPTGAGGAGGWTLIGNGGVVDLNPSFATNSDNGGGCFERKTYTYAPDGVGGYLVSAGPAVFDANIGQLAGATGDDTITAVGLDLGFPMLFPDGSAHQLVDIDPNGRILPTAAAGTSGDLSPSVLDITTDGYPYFFGAWTDWNVNEPTSDGIYFNTVPGVSATFTWNNVSQFGTNERPCTWQIVLYSGGVVQVTHQDLSGFNDRDGGFSSSDDFATGLTSGNGADPGELDFSALGFANAAAIAYELWDSSGAAPVEPLDLKLSGVPSLVALTAPLQPGSYDLQIQGSGAAGFGFYLLGLSSQDVYAGPFGIPCTLRVQNIASEFRLADGLGDIQPLNVAIPASPVFVGTTIVSQGATDSAPFATPFYLTNSIVGTVGDL